MYEQQLHDIRSNVDRAVAELLTSSSTNNNFVQALVIILIVISYINKLLLRNVMPDPMV
jgi:hypothetical protein